MRDELQRLVEARVNQCVQCERLDNQSDKIERKKQCHLKRDAEIVKASAVGQIRNIFSADSEHNVHYYIHWKYLIKQKDFFYIEEEVEERTAKFYDGEIVADVEIGPPWKRLENNSQPNLSGTDFRLGGEFGTNHSQKNVGPLITIRSEDEARWEERMNASGNHAENEAAFAKVESRNSNKLHREAERQNYKGNEGESRLSYHYDRLKAVRYAERWWNSYNPAYLKFENDCTNFISQCLHQGGAPMRGYPNRGKGWWLKGKNYSYSWASAHGLKNYLANSKTGLRAKEVSSPEQLLLGDVICYDFEGDGRFNHNTIVTGKDANGMPLVNAHTYNSRQRYWAYEDSTAYTPNIKYKFFSIVCDS